MDKPKEPHTYVKIFVTQDISKLENQMNEVLKEIDYESYYTSTPAVAFDGKNYILVLPVRARAPKVERERGSWTPGTKFHYVRKRVSDEE